jgi:hypothetical protein
MVTLWEDLRIRRAAVALAGAMVSVADAVIAIVVGTVGEAEAIVMIMVGTVEGVVVLATAAIVVVVAVVLTARSSKLSTVLQAEISVEDGMEMVVNATAWLWLMVTAFALGPVPIRQAMEISGTDCFPPSLAQL